MRIVYERAAVRVPATTANMGPGFDSFGMAFRYYDEVSVRPITGTTRVIVEGVGAETVPTDDDNLVVQALRAGLDAVGAPQAGFEMRCVNRIPHGGGMGSSASAAVAGLMLARGLIAEPEALSDDRIFALATDFEGHPDNVAPAVFGGATVAWVERGGHPRMAPMPVDASLGVSLLIPPATTRLSTKEARQVLPVSVPREDALFNMSTADVPTCSWPEPRTASTRSTGAESCPPQWPSWTRCASRATRPSSPAPVPRCWSCPPWPIRPASPWRTTAGACSAPESTPVGRS